MSPLPLRRALLVVAAAAALVAVLAGLARLGVVGGLGAARAAEHGPLFVVGVFGTIIALERAVALGGLASLAAPALGAAAAAAMVLGLPLPAHALAAASTAALVVVNAAVVKRQAASFTWLMLAGSVALAAGAALWALGWPVFRVAPSWLAFFALTIAAERLELSRLAPTPRWASRTVVVLGAVVVVGAGAAAFDDVVAPRVLGVALLLLGAWQLRFDLARRTVRSRGLPRFAAAGVLAGSAWLVVAGAVLVVDALPAAGPVYDAALHSVFVGFALSMVFAHAPIILPAVARIDVPFHPVLYAPLAVLHAGLAARVAGDLLGIPAARTSGAVAIAIALALFLFSVVVARTRRGRRTVRAEEPLAAHRS